MLVKVLLEPLGKFSMKGRIRCRVKLEQGRLNMKMWVLWTKWNIRARRQGRLTGTAKKGSWTGYENGIEAHRQGFHGTAEMACAIRPS